MKAIFSYCINARTVCLLAFACASIAVAACCIIWLFAKLLVSCAKSVSCIRPRAEERLTEMLSKFAIVDDNLLDNAISLVSTRRGELGALSNRLSSTIANLDNISVNLSSARGRIQDTDFAQETSNLAKSQIMQQAATAMLAQANASKQTVLALIQ